MVRLCPALLANVDGWIAAQRDLYLSRPEAIRRLMAERLATQAEIAELAELKRQFVILDRRIDALAAERARTL